MHPAKNNFKKMHLLNLKCSLGCNSDEDQRHIFENCEVLKSHLHINMYDYIYLDKKKTKRSNISIYYIGRKKKSNISSASRHPVRGGSPWLCHGRLAS